MAGHVDRGVDGVALEDRSGDRELQIVDRAAEAAGVERRGADAELDVAAAVASVAEAAEAETEVPGGSDKGTRLVDEVVQDGVIRSAQDLDSYAVPGTGLLRWGLINRRRGQEVDEVARAGIVRSSDARLPV